MAASAWVVFNKAKEYLGDATIDLDGHQLFIKLLKNLTTLSAGAATAWTQLTASEVTALNGYSAAMASLVGVTWATGASAGEMRLDATAKVFSASGGAIVSIRNAVIHTSNGELLCYSALSTADFEIANGSSLTVTPSANGIFELN